MSSSYWNSLGDQISQIFLKYHDKKSKLSEKERSLGIKKEFRTLLDQVTRDCLDEAQDYINRRKPEDKKLLKIQSQVKKQLDSLLDNLGIKFQVFPASSFSAGTNLIGESDLDFNVGVEDLDVQKSIQVSNLCGAHGYLFTETRGAHKIENVHFVFQKFINNVEIEFKMRELKYYLPVYAKMHDYLDNKMSKKDQMIVTLIKYHMKQHSKQKYSDFKALYYENALSNAGVYELLYPLV